MNFAVRIFSYFVIFLISATSVLQYHHHDIDGGLCVVFHECDHSSDEQNSGFEHSDKNHNENSEKNCGAKLSQLAASKEIHEVKPAVFSLIMEILVDFSLIESLDKNEHCSIIWIAHPIKTLIYKSIPFRAPPFL